MIVNPLFILLFVSLCSCILVFVLPLNSEQTRLFSLWCSVINLLQALFLLVSFDKLYGGFQFLFCLDFLSAFNLVATFGMDGISLWLVVLTAFLVLLCILISWGIN